MKKQIRIALTHGSARVDENVSPETIAALNKLSVIAYHSPITNKPMKNKNQKSAQIITDLECREKSVLIFRTQEESKTLNGVIISETTKEPRPIGILVAVGPLCKEDLQKGIGRKVLYNRFANLEVVDGNGNVLMAMEDHDVKYFIPDNSTILDDSGEKKKRININKN